MTPSRDAEESIMKMVRVGGGFPLIVVGICGGVDSCNRIAKQIDKTFSVSDGPIAGIIGVGSDKGYMVMTVFSMYAKAIDIRNVIEYLENNDRVDTVIVDHAASFVHKFKDDKSDDEPKKESKKEAEIHELAANIVRLKSLIDSAPDSDKKHQRRQQIKDIFKVAMDAIDD